MEAVGKSIRGPQRMLVSYGSLMFSRILFLVTSNGSILNEISLQNAKFQNVLKVRKFRSARGRSAL